MVGMNTKFFIKYFQEIEGDKFMPSSLPTNLLQFLCFPEGKDQEEQADRIVLHGCSMLYCERFNMSKIHLNVVTLESNLFKSTLTKYKAALKLELFSRYGIFMPVELTREDVLISGIQVKLNPNLVKYIDENSFYG